MNDKNGETENYKRSRNAGELYKTDDKYNIIQIHTASTQQHCNVLNMFNMDTIMI